MIRVHKAFLEKDLSSKILLQVHDELLFEVDESAVDQTIEIARDGPYQVRGGIALEGTDLFEGASQEHYALCRCGHSRNKPFCDGSHWYAGFKDDEAQTIAKAAKAGQFVRVLAWEKGELVPMTLADWDADGLMDIIAGRGGARDAVERDYTRLDVMPCRLGPCL